MKILNKKALLFGALIFLAASFEVKAEETVVLRFSLDATRVNFRRGDALGRMGYIERGTELEIRVPASLVPNRDSLTRADIEQIVSRMESRRASTVRADGRRTQFTVQPVRVVQPGAGTSSSVAQSPDGFVALQLFARQGKLALRSVQRPLPPGEVAVPEALRPPEPRPGVAAGPAQDPGPQQVATLPPDVAPPRLPEAPRPVAAAPLPVPEPEAPPAIPRVQNIPPPPAPGPALHLPQRVVDRSPPPPLGETPALPPPPQAIAAPVLPEQGLAQPVSPRGPAVAAAIPGASGASVLPGAAPAAMPAQEPADPALAAIPAPAPAQTPAPRNLTGERVAVLGDSHVNGWQRCGLSTRLAAGGNAVEMHGLGGSSPAHWVAPARGTADARGRDELRARSGFMTSNVNVQVGIPMMDSVLHRFRPTAIVLEFGDNFAGYNLSRSTVNAAAVRAQVDQILARLREYPNYDPQRCFFVTPTFGERRRVNGTDYQKNDAQLASLIAEIRRAVGNRCTVVDSRSLPGMASGRVGTGDGLHLNPEYCRIWANGVADLVRRNLAQLPPIGGSQMAAPRAPAGGAPGRTQEAGTAITPGT